MATQKIPLGVVVGPKGDPGETRIDGVVAGNLIKTDENGFMVDSDLPSNKVLVSGEWEDDYQFPASTNPSDSQIIVNDSGKIRQRPLNTIGSGIGGWETTGYPTYMMLSSGSTGLVSVPLNTVGSRLFPAMGSLFAQLMPVGSTSGNTSTKFVIMTGSSGIYNISSLDAVSKIITPHLTSGVSETTGGDNIQYVYVSTNGIFKKMTISNFKTLLGI